MFNRLRSGWRGLNAAFCSLQCYIIYLHYHVSSAAGHAFISQIHKKAKEIIPRHNLNHFDLNMMCLLRELGNYLACVHWRDILAFCKLKL